MKSQRTIAGLLMLIISYQHWQLQQTRGMVDDARRQSEQLWKYTATIDDNVYRTQTGERLKRPDWTIQRGANP